MKHCWVVWYSWKCEELTFPGFQVKSLQSPVWADFEQGFETNPLCFILFRTFFIFISKNSHEIFWPQSAKLAIAPFKTEIDWKLTIWVRRGEFYLFAPLKSKIVSFQSISDLNGAIASLADWGQKISFEFFEIKLKKFRKSIKHKGLVSNTCWKSAPRQGLFAALDLRSLTLWRSPQYYL